MLQAWILVCLISNPSVCFEAQDTRGLHITRQQCMNRVEEMAQSISTIPDHRPMAFRCMEIKGKLAV